MTNQLPAIRTFRNGNRAEAVAGYCLKSLLLGGLFRQSGQSADSEKPDSNGNLHENELRSGREGVLRALAAWGSESTLELSFTAFPDFAVRQRGRLMITIILRVSAASRAEAREKAAIACLSLRATMKTQMPEAEFVPITSAGELTRTMKPFQSVHAISIHRRREEIPLSAPFARRTIGLEAGLTCEGKEGVVLWHLAPWVPSGDGWERFIHMMMGQLDSVCAVLRVRPVTVKEKIRLRYEEQIRECELFLSGGASNQVAMKGQIGILRDVAVRRLAGLRRQAYSVGIFLLSPHPIDRALGCTLGNAITADQSQDRKTGFFEGGFAISEVTARKALEASYFHDEEPFTIEEAACAFRLPSPPVAEVPGLRLRRSRTALASMPRGDKRKDGADLELFYSQHQQDTLPVSIEADDRMRHMFIPGQTGTGKSTLMEYMILQDIRAGRGVAVIDPHGDLVDTIVGKIPDNRVEDVILFDLLDRGWPLGFNLLQWETLEERDLLIDELYANVDNIYDLKETGGPIFEMHFRGMLKLLMGDRKREDFTPTLLDFVTCYLSKDFRIWLLARTDEASTCDFVKEAQKAGFHASLENIAPYVTSKFGRFVHDRTLSRIIGQEKSSFNVDEIMHEGKIFLVKLGKGRFGSTVSALLANQLVTRFKLAAMKRGDMKSKERKDFFLYVDECHTLPSDNFTELLSEARKFRLGLILTTQYTAQIKQASRGRSDLLSAILGNVGTIATFRLGHEDAKMIAPVLSPLFGALDIIGLPNWHGYARMQPHGEAILPFSFRSLKDETVFDDARAERVRELSRRHGMPASDIDTMLEQRRSINKKRAEDD